jgi:hypothetical protein
MLEVGTCIQLLLLIFFTGPDHDSKDCTGTAD